MMKIQKFNKGFTLVELMVTLAISSLVMSSIYAVFHKQVATHNTERLVVSMQQNVRAAVSFMERDIRMARYDPTGSGNFDIRIANNAQLQFESDNNVEDGAIGAGETITYAMVDDGGVSCDADGNGIADGMPCNLGRNNGGGFQTVARSIDALNFDYFDANGNSVLVDAVGNSIRDPAATPWSVPAGQIANIRSIRLSIVARSGDTIPVLFINHRDSKVYRNRPRDTDGDGIADTADVILPARNNDFRRMQVTTEIDCRN
jgi:type IV pilus assembly protein PilW